MRQFIAAAALIAAVIIFTAACDTADSAFSADWRGETGESDSAGDKGNAERGNLSEKIDEKEISDLTAQCEAVVSMYCDIYPGEKGADGDGNRKGNPNRDLIDRIEDRLAEWGFPVLNTDPVCPPFLENPEEIFEFWESMKSGKETAEQNLIWVKPSGGFYYCSLRFCKGEKYCITASVSFDEKGGMEIDGFGKNTVIGWELTERKHFYYGFEDSYSFASDDYVMIRLEPEDPEMGDYRKKYISPVGYSGANLFLCSWDSSDYGDLCFNDLLEYLYEMKTGSSFDEKTYPSFTDPYYYYRIPEGIFERTILPYFDISLPEFRQRTLYDSRNKSYPWQSSYGDHLPEYSSLVPEVRSCRQNQDGTITLSVDVMCADLRIDRLFSHEVTIGFSEENREQFQYLANKITYLSEGFTLPEAEPRLLPQKNRTA
ncbi:MAG: DUF6070 family protein [Anaerovoracaceae bacterium]